MPEDAAQLMAASKTLFPVISVKLTGYGPSAPGFPAIRHKNVTIAARLQVFSGRYVPSSQPCMIPNLEHNWISG